MKHKAKNLIFPIFLPMQGCKERCIYCDQHLITSSNGIDPEKQLSQAKEFLQAHPNTKRQIAFYGGSFTALPEQIRDELLAPLMMYMDSEASFRLSTHPSAISFEIISWCKSNLIKTIELGIQDFDDLVLKASKRQYNHLQALKACTLVKDAGLELGVQLMPGLPGSSLKSMLFNQLTIEKIKPDFLRLYPTIVIKHTILHQMWQKGQYQPQSLEEAIDQCVSWLQMCDKAQIKVIKMGLPSQMDQSSIVAGPWHPTFGQLVQAELLVRELEQNFAPGSIIELDKNQWALIVANNRMYQLVLQERIAGCKVRKKSRKMPPKQNP